MYVSKQDPWLHVVAQQRVGMFGLREFAAKNYLNVDIDAEGPVAVCKQRTQRKDWGINPRAILCIT